MNQERLRLFNQLEERLKNNQIEKEAGIKIFRGTVPILLSAPHSVSQLREGKIKVSEARTAPIVQYIHEQTACYSAFKTMNFGDDANYDPKNYYKDALIDLIKENNIKALFDLHIMAPARKHNIDIGTGYGANTFHRDDLQEIIKANFLANQIDKVAINHRFSASFANTVSATIARECQIPSFQIEMNWRLLDENLEENKLKAIIKALVKNIEEFKEIL